MIRVKLGAGDFAVNRQSSEASSCPGECLPPGSSSLHAFYVAPGALFAVTDGALLAGVDLGAFFMLSFLPERGQVLVDRAHRGHPS